MNPKDFYYFDDQNKEVCFKRYDMPTPWMNYLSNGTFHTMMSQAGGACAFYKSPQIFRINRYRFFHLPTDRSGMYYYIQDKKSGEYFCPTAEPAFVKPTKWQSYHGMGYSRFEAERGGVKTILTYFVAPDKNTLVWNLELENTTDQEKDLNVYAYVEFGMMEFMRELQWVCYNKHQLSVDYMDNDDVMIYKYGVEMQPRPDETPLIYLASDYPVAGYDGDRDEFVGSYRSESNPKAIEEGGCTGSTLKGGDPCGALQYAVTLAPGEKKTINTFMGAERTHEQIKSTVETLRTNDFVPVQYDKLQQNWDTYLSKFHATVPDENTQRMINIWNPYQSERNFQFSRNISFYATGTFRGVGYRDTMQDVLAMVPFDLRRAKDKVNLLLTQQYNDGHVNHYFFPTEGWDPVTSIHSDDHLWSVMAAYDIVKEEGSFDFLDEVVEFFDGGSATVWEHLKKAIDFTCQNIGEQGFPLMLRSDWNDMLYKVCKEGKGESIWTAMQFAVVLKQMARLAEAKNEDGGKYMALFDQMKENIGAKAWDGKWYRRAIMDSGEFVGTEKQDEAKIWLNTQSWSILSGTGEKERTVQAMQSVYDILNTPLGIKKIYPPIVNFPSPQDPLSHYNPGTGENGSVFCHANTWAIIAECMLGNGDRAYEYYRQLIPANALEKAGIWRYKAEPYVYASNIFGPESDKFGLANVSWLSGTAAWMYVAVTQYILGIRADFDGLLIDPCLPSEWNDVTVQRVFRGKTYHINIKRTGNNKVILNGTEMPSNVVLGDLDVNEVTVEI